MDWLINRIHEPNPDGSFKPSIESTVATIWTTGFSIISTDIEGLAGSRRDEAHKQLQLDIYGELMDALSVQQIRHSHFLQPLGRTPPAGHWVCDNWRQKTRAFGKCAADARTFSTPK